MSNETASSANGQTISDENLLSELEKGYEPAQELLKTPDKVEKLLQIFENKVRLVPLAGNLLAVIPVMVSMVRSYIKKEYTKIPLRSVLAILSAVLYFAGPADIIPDFLPLVGYVDDIAVILLCLKLVNSEVDSYIKWREVNDKIIES